MTLELLLDRMKAEANPKAAVELPFEWAASSVPLWRPSPSREAVDQVLAEFGRLVRRERRKDKALPGGEIDSPKVLRDERAEVMDAIREFNREPAEMWFPQLNRQRLAVELALLVRRPRLLSTEQAGWSGPCSLLIHYAKSDPQAFAQFAIDVFRSGSGTWRNQQLQVAPELRESVLPGEPNTCIAALVTAVAAQPAQGLHAAHTPEAMAQTVQSLGYQQIEIRDSAWLAGAGEPAGPVLLLLAPSLLREITGREIPETHWAILRRIRHTPEPAVKFLTYAGSWEVNLEKRVMLSGISRVITAI